MLNKGKAFLAAICVWIYEKPKLKSEHWLKTKIRTWTRLLQTARCCVLPGQVVQSFPRQAWAPPLGQRLGEPGVGVGWPWAKQVPRMVKGPTRHRRRVSRRRKYQPNIAKRWPSISSNKRKGLWTSSTQVNLGLHKHNPPPGEITGDPWNLTLAGGTQTVKRW